MLDKHIINGIIIFEMKKESEYSPPDSTLAMGL